MKTLISFSVIFLLISCTGSTNKESIREISQGQLIGKNSENNTFSWKGIPFAKPPINELRWKAPQMAAPWEGLLAATDFKNECFHVHEVTGVVFDFRVDGLQKINISAPVYSISYKKRAVLPKYTSTARPIPKSA